MVIDITDGVTTQRLCDGPDRSANKSTGPDNLVVDGPVTPDAADFLRATNAKVYNRGNLVHDISWTVRRLLASVALAEDYALEHPQTVLRGTQLLLITATGTRTFSYGTLVGCRCRHVGATVFIDYRFSGGVRT